MSLIKEKKIYTTGGVDVNWCVIPILKAKNLASKAFFSDWREFVAVIRAFCLQNNVQGTSFVLHLKR